jgi:cytochrome c oxidase cbb3-type subunit 3
MMTIAHVRIGLVSILCLLPLNRDAPLAQQTPRASNVAIDRPVGPVPGPARASSSRLPENPFQHDAVARQAGRKLFLAFNCAGCHGDHAGGGMGPSLRDKSWIYGSEPAQIYDSISEGRAHGMPAWGTMLPPQTIWQLVTYLQSLRSSDEPEPPE